MAEENIHPEETGKPEETAANEIAPANEAAAIAPEPHEPFELKHPVPAAAPNAADSVPSPPETRSRRVPRLTSARTASPTCVGVSS